MANRKAERGQGAGRRGGSVGQGRSGSEGRGSEAKGRRQEVTPVASATEENEGQVREPRGPRLTLVATPIGNLGDLSARTIETLKDADLWLAEDTRVSGKLAAHLEIKRPMRLLNEHTGPGAMERYLDEIETGLHAALVSDGGAPGISDPGAIFTDLAHEREIPISGIPGPSAPILALMVSGFFAQRFSFLGFLPRKAGDIRRELQPFVDSPFTIVLFESPHRVDASLQILGEVLGSRRFCICREMTKMYEEIFRGELPILPNEDQMPRRGEFTIVIEGRRKSASRVDS